MIERLIDEVVVPFNRYLIDTEAGSIHLKDRDEQFRHKYHLAMLTVSLIKEPKMAKKKLQEAAKAHNELNIPSEVMKECLNLYFKLLLDFTKKMGKSSIIEDRLDEYSNFFIEAYTPKDSDDFFDDDFFDFDSEDVDSAINKMHYDEKEKISAVEFMQEDLIDDHMIADLDDAIEHYDDYTSHIDNFDDEYLSLVSKCLEEFITILNVSYEFRDLAYALESLVSLIVNYKVGDKSKDELLKALLDTVIDDLENWKKEVVDEQSAVDIHYLDASLLSNVSQIEIMLRM